ncbi:MAG: hypothetical protein U9P71_04325 [Campylobacterota bacterium]|nr:hypothetical protein [Campylobacterota bacterium]
MQGANTYLDEDDLTEVYANFHGMIVEYMKLHSSRKGVEIIF